MKTNLNGVPDETEESESVVDLAEGRVRLGRRLAPIDHHPLLLARQVHHLFLPEHVFVPQRREIALSKQNR